MKYTSLIAVLITIYCWMDKASIVSAEDESMVETRAMVNEESRKKQQENSLMSRILPMLATPFIMQVTFLPMVLMGMKFMLLNSMFLGKLGVLLWIIHLIRKNNNDGGGLYSHNIHLQHNNHEGHWYDQKKIRFSEHYNYRRRRRRRNV